MAGPESIVEARMLLSRVEHHLAELDEALAATKEIAPIKEFWAWIWNGMRGKGWDVRA